jgi:hypothetical protein
MDADETATATRETYAEAAKDDSGLVRLWLDAIAIAGNEEDPWRKCAADTAALYRNTSPNYEGPADRKFNILHANIETLCPALFNSTPIPDVRRRFNDADPIAKVVSDVLDRSLSYSIDCGYDFDHVIKLTVKDSELTGRGVARERYKPYLDEQDQLAYQELVTEHTPWKHFRRGPAEVWEDVPWIAFELFLTRDELVRLSPEDGAKVKLDVTVNGVKDNDGQGRNVPEVFKRARVWEIWDRDHRQVLFIAESFKEKPIRTEADPLELEGFYPIPRPLYSISSSDSLIPVVPYDVYRSQAETLEITSKRIDVLTEAIKAKSLYDSRLATDMERLEREDDAASVPVENLAVFGDGSKLADHVMYLPIEIMTAALEKLYIAREQTKQTIYEITGIADILRGQTDPNETLGAQQIKQQWGSLRIQNKQAEIQRFVRDIFRIKAELFASKFEWQTLSMMTGIKLPTMQEKQQAQMIAQQAQQMQQPVPAHIQKALESPSQEEVEQVLRSDKQRTFSVDVESDSTIRADMMRNQQTMALFVQGTAQFWQAIGPLVMADKGVMPVAVEIYSALSRSFKLGRQAEDALDGLAEKAQQAANAPPQPDPAVQMEQKKLEAEQQARGQELQFKQAESQQKLQFEAAKHEQQMQFEVQKHRAEMEMAQQDMQFKQVQHEQNLQADQQKMAVDAQGKAEERQLNFAAKQADTEARAKPSAEIKLDANDAVKEMAPAMTEMMTALVQAMAQAAQASAASAQAMEKAAEALAAPSEIVRDPRTGRAKGTVKVMPSRAMN